MRAHIAASRPSRAAGAVVIFALALTSSSALAEAGDAAVRCVSAAAVFYPGDTPEVYVEFRNATPELWEQFLPAPDMTWQFPWSWFRVTRDGIRLPQAVPELNTEPNAAMVRLRPGETFTVRVPLSSIAALPKEPSARAGEYRIAPVREPIRQAMAAGKEVVFRVEQRPPEGEPQGLARRLAVPGWERLVTAGGAKPAAKDLADIIEDPGQPALVRRRALRTLGAVITPGDFKVRLVEMIHRSDPILASMIVEEAPGIKLPETYLMGVLITAAGLSKDLAVRRSAVGELLKVRKLSARHFETLVEAREDEIDLEMRYLLLEVLKHSRPAEVEEEVPPPAAAAPATPHATAPATATSRSKESGGAR